jgi:hypothetical protein
MAENDRSEYIAQMARQLGLDLPEQEVARVKMVFANLERAADLLRDTEMSDDTMAAAVFTPWPGN